MTQEQYDEINIAILEEVEEWNNEVLSMAQQHERLIRWEQAPRFEDLSHAR